MKQYIIYFLNLMLPVLMLSQGPAASADRSFGNTDLEIDKGDVNGVIIPESSTSAPVTREKVAKNKQYWCSKGTSQKLKRIGPKTRSRLQNGGLPT